MFKDISALGQKKRIITVIKVIKASAIFVELSELVSLVQGTIQYIDQYIQNLF